MPPSYILPGKRGKDVAWYKLNILSSLVRYSICLKCLITEKCSASFIINNTCGVWGCFGDGMMKCHLWDTVLGLLDKPPPVLRLWNKAAFVMEERCDYLESANPSSTWQCSPASSSWHTPSATLVGSRDWEGQGKCMEALFFWSGRHPEPVLLLPALQF